MRRALSSILLLFCLGLPACPADRAATSVASAGGAAGTARSDRRASDWIGGDDVGGSSAHATAPTPARAQTDAGATPARDDPAAVRRAILAEVAGRAPRAWGRELPGTRTRLDTDDAVIALTFDACGGHNGDGYDAELIELLRRERVPATLFMSGRWIDARRETFLALARDPLFEIANHGVHHRPCSANGRLAYGIRGTRGVGEMVDEIQDNGLAIERLTGRAPRYYRSGTAFYDDICVEVAERLGQVATNFTVIGDGGVGFTREEIRDTLRATHKGSIVIFHMNHPGGETREGLRDAIPELRRRGLRFVQLSEYPLK